MPELPEVQTTVDGLNQKVRGKTIASAWSNWSRLICGYSIESLNNKIRGAKILGARRRGKNIFIDLDTKETLHVHMKMTGHFLFGKWRLENGKWLAIAPATMRDDPKNRFVRFVITFTDGNQLALSDVRRFAKIGLYPTLGIEEHCEIGPLGPEPLAKNFSANHLAVILDNHTIRPIKQFLMDQTKIAGIGNIYSDEMLWRAGIHPRRRPQTLTRPEIAKLHTAMRAVLKAGITLGGDSNVDYRNIDGERGRFQSKHQAYRRTGKPCLKRDCKGVIKREIIGARSAHYCPEHQR